MASKYQQLAEILRRDHVDGHCGEKLPTEQELSARYQVSRQTVRHALQLLADERLIEKRQGSGSYAIGAAQATRHQITIITSFFDEYIFPTILHDAQSVFSQHGFSTSIYATENQVSREREILQNLLANPVDGILVEGSKTALPNPNSDLYQRLLRNNHPIVFLHAAYSNLPEVPCVSDDNYGGGYQLVSYLLERGHRQIAGIFKSDDLQGHERYHGCISALRDRGAEIHDRRFWWYDTEDRAEIVERQNPSLLRRFLSDRLNGATAVVCYNDEIAFYLIRELTAMGRKVPEEVAVVSFDDSYYSQISPIHITSLGHRPNRIGRVAAEHLLRSLQGGGGGSLALPWTLIQRESG